MTKSPRILRWLVAHTPVDLFLRTAQAFGQEIERATDGELQVQVISKEDYWQEFHNQHGREPSMRDLFSDLEAGKFEIFQTEVRQYSCINNHFMALDLPFLFRDHEHAARVLDGKIGRALCDSLSMKSKIRGLAFTYSGGYRVIGSKEPVNTVDGLANKTLITSRNPAAYRMVERIGAVPVQVEYSWNHVADVNDHDAIETTYLRFGEYEGKHILKTEHSLFLTTISINLDLWNSLDSRLQDLMQEVATKTAQLERKWSVEDAEKFEQEAALKGISIIEISKEDLDRLHTMSKDVYEEAQGWFTPGFLKAIQTQ